MEQEVQTTKNLNESIIQIRVKLQDTKLKKSGKNKFAGFDYYELKDFLPTLNKLMLEEGVNDLFTINDNVAKLILIKGEERQEYTIPFVIFETPTNKNGQPSMQDIQYLGALNTYYKRYLYLNAFGITDGEIIDAMDNKELKAKGNKEEKVTVPTNREKLIVYCKEHDIDMKDVAKQYKLNSTSTDDDFLKALIDMEG